MHSQSHFPAAPPAAVHLDATGAPVDRLTALRAAKAKREETETKRRETLELEELELEEKFLGLGTRGLDFDILVTLKGCVVVKKPSFTGCKRFNAVKNKTEEDAATLVNECVVHPAAPEIRALCTDHPGVWWELASLCLQMANAGGSRAGK